MEKFTPLETTDKEIEEIARRIFETVIETHKIEDYQGFITLLSERVKQDIPRETFDQTIANELGPLGEVKKIIYMGSVRKRSIITLWKTKHENTKDETLWRMALAKSGQEVKIVGLDFH